MAKVTLSRASKDTGVSLPTLSRWRALGKISAKKNPNGSYEIDTSEYDRIQDLKKSSSSLKGNVNPSMKQLDTLNESRVEGFKMQIDLLHNQLKDREIIIQDLREDRDDWKKQAQTILLQDQRMSPFATPDERNKRTSQSKRWIEWLLLFILMILIGILSWQIIGFHLL